MFKFFDWLLSSDIEDSNVSIKVEGNYVQSGNNIFDGGLVDVNIGGDYNQEGSNYTTKGTKINIKTRGDHTQK
jgi:hypothetical protein